MDVAISGDIAVVSAVNDDDAGRSSGAAYIYSRNKGGEDNWGQVTKLTANDAAPRDNFGKSVAISGETIIIGADEDDNGFSNTGSVYIFKMDEGDSENWIQIDKLTANDETLNDYFGRHVAISGEVVVISCTSDDDLGKNSGSAYIFSSADETTSISTIDITTTLQCKISPNPFQEEAEVTWNNPWQKTFSVTILNPKGQRVQSYPKIRGNSFTIQKDQLQQGIYFLKFVDESGKSEVSKFVIN